MLRKDEAQRFLFSFSTILILPIFVDCYPDYILQNICSKRGVAGWRLNEKVHWIAFCHATTKSMYNSFLSAVCIISNINLAKSLAFSCSSVDLWNIYPFPRSIVLHSLNGWKLQIQLSVWSREIFSSHDLPHMKKLCYNSYILIILMQLLVFFLLVLCCMIFSSYFLQLCMLTALIDGVMNGGWESTT